MKTNVLNESSKGTEVIRLEDKLFDSGIIFLDGEVDQDSCITLIQQLLYLESRNIKEITIYINSPGGEVIAGLSVYDTIMGLKTPVKTVAIGTAASMGSIIFLAGRKRYMLPHSRVLIHDPLLTLSGTKSALALDKDARHLMEIREVLAGIISKRSGLSLDEVYDKTREDTYLSAKEALDLGIATRIITHLGQDERKVSA